MPFSFFLWRSLPAILDSYPGICKCSDYCRADDRLPPGLSSEQHNRVHLRLGMWAEGRTGGKAESANISRANNSRGKFVIKVSFSCAAHTHSDKSLRINPLAFFVTSLIYTRLIWHNLSCCFIIYTVSSVAIQFWQEESKTKNKD